MINFTPTLFSKIVPLTRVNNTIGLSGGTSIEAFLKYASKNSKWLVTSKFIMIDERDVCPSHPYSNLGQARKALGSKASITSTKTIFEENWSSINLDVVVMGFGVDGHFASLFQV